MIDEKTLADREWAAKEVGDELEAEIIRLARRYLALRKDKVLLDTVIGIFIGGKQLDAAADRLLDGGK